MADEQVTSESEKKKEDWMNSKWRPMMGWMYMLICTMDMVVFPVLWSLLQAITHTAITQWNPLTLQGAGLFHIAMGAVLGIAAFGRTQEKLNGANNGGAQTPATGFAGGSTGFSVPASTPAPATGGFGAPTQTTVTQTFGSPAGGFGGTSQVTTGFGGKPAPVQPERPAI
jgi:hypothetical protein